MNKFLKIFELLLKLWYTFFPPKKKVVSTKDENFEVMKAALNSVEQTEEVVKAKKKIEYIETLPEKEREEKQAEIQEVQKIVEEKAAAKPITEKRAKSLIDRYKNKRGG